MGPYAVAQPPKSSTEVEGDEGGERLLVRHAERGVMASTWSGFEQTGKGDSELRMMSEDPF